MSLSRAFPPEVFSVVTEHLDGLYVLRLWSTGDAMLRTKLRLAVKKFRLEWNGREPFHWLPLIAEFSEIVDLELKNHDSIRKWECRGLQLTHLARKLRRLSLGFSNADELFEERTVNSAGQTVTTFVNMDDWFANLKELRLEHLDRTRPGLLKVLPRQLEYLTILSDSSSFLSEPFWIRYLPPTLKRIEGVTSESLFMSLDSNIRELISVEKSSLVEHLQHVEEWRVKGQFTPLFLQLLPKNCKAIVPGNTISNLIPLIQGSARHLPRTLTSLEIRCDTLTRRFVSFLPKTLTWLFLASPACTNLENLHLDLPNLIEFNHTTSSAEKKASWTILPKNLKTLILDYDPDWPALSASHITRLNTDYIYQEHEAKMLPSSLQDIEVTKFPYNWTPTATQFPELRSVTTKLVTITETFANNLPKTLTKLHVTNWPNPVLITVLPSTLTDFVALPPSDRVSPYSNDLRSDLPRQKLQFPPNLTRFQFGFPAQSKAEDFENLQHLARLQILQIGTLADLVDTEVLKYIPTDMKEPSHLQPSASTSVEIPERNNSNQEEPTRRLVKDMISKPVASLTHLVLKCREPLTSQLLSMLPSNLRVLAIESPVGAQIDDTDLDRLPAGLVKLSLPVCPNVSPHYTEHLPKHLPRMGTVINRAKLPVKQGTQTTPELWGTPT